MKLVMPSETQCSAHFRKHWKPFFAVGGSCQLKHKLQPMEEVRHFAYT